MTGAVVLPFTGSGLPRQPMLGAYRLEAIASAAANPGWSDHSVDLMVVHWLDTNALSGPRRTGWAASTARAADLLASLLPDWRIDLASYGVRLISPEGLKAFAPGPTLARALISAIFSALLQSLLQGLDHRAEDAHG